LIRVELHDRANRLVQILAGAKSAAYHPVLNSDGAASFKIHRADADVAALSILTGGIDGYIVHLLRKGPLEAAFTDRFSFVVESIGFGIDQQEESNAWITVAGRGTLCLLEDRISFPPGFDGVNPATMVAQWRVWGPAGGGAIMGAEIAASAPRFSVPITAGVQTTTVPQTVKLRFDNLRLLHDYLVQSGPMDAQMFGLDYQCVDVRGIDKSASVSLQLGPQDSLLGVQVLRDVKSLLNWVIAQGTGEGINSKLAVAIDAPGIAAFRRREGFLDDRQVDNQAQLGLDATGSLAQFKRAVQSITVKFTDSGRTQLYRDFDLGDTIGAVVQPLQISSKYRVVGYTVADTDAEIEDVSLDLNSMRQEYLIKLLLGVVAPAVGSLSVLNRQPQGAPYNDSFGFPDSADGTYPWRVKRFIPSNLLKLNYCKFSFSLGAFRSPVAAVNNPSVTSGSSSAASSGATSTNHVHQLAFINAAITWPMGLDAFLSFAANGASGTLATGNMSADHTHLIPHTHSVTSNVTLTYGIFEGTTATNVKVLINGTDRTVALGGAAGGFTTDQAELEISQWLNIGAWNTFELQPSNLGRVYGDVRMTGYIQSA
jgi:Siphovirus ReqiPepy6 Gp37-like protein